MTTAITVQCFVCNEPLHPAMIVTELGHDRFSHPGCLIYPQDFVESGLLKLAGKLASAAEPHVGHCVTVYEATEFITWKNLPEGTTVAECLVDFVQYVNAIDDCFGILPLPGQDLGNTEVQFVTIPAKGLF